LKGWSELTENVAWHIVRSLIKQSAMNEWLHIQPKWALTGSQAVSDILVKRSGAVLPAVAL
jgi:hypothetical protein